MRLPFLTLSLLIAFLIAVNIVGYSHVSLSLVDHPRSLLPGTWLDPFPDLFKELEHLPFELERESNIPLLPARVDWKETPEGHAIKLDVPGLKKEALKIEVEENRVLRVSGERKKEEEKKGDHWNRVERYYGKFWRQFKLPENADLDAIKANLQDGVLTLSFPKLSPDKIMGPRVVEIGRVEGDHAKLKNTEAKQEL